MLVGDRCTAMNLKNTNFNKFKQKKTKVGWLTNSPCAKNLSLSADKD
ncbi:hypothetical protein COLO4_10811 [Corchorus olitorius]|uniref:Uncharacterized protein n=1 Tax=Corchorus olitorius TaxID=93759 RepID=A0A1R3K6T6_9ROSI|nr:hypothetical protein COLO4_10811 [Corchorus olitorius]